jgi:hypothetical protein
VTNVGSARYDRNTGDWIGGGIRPDIICESSQGVPRNVGADLCVGVALGALEDAEIQEEQARSLGEPLLKRVGSSSDGAGVRRRVSAGIVKERPTVYRC